MRVDGYLRGKVMKIDQQYDVVGTYEIPYQFTNLVMRRISALLTVGNAQTMTLAAMLQNAYIIGVNDAIQALQDDQAQGGSDD